MEITGTITKLLELKTGINKAGKQWTKQDFIIETPGQYPKTVLLSAWGDITVPQQGTTITASIDIESREYNGKYYTDVKAYKITTNQEQDDLPMIGENKDLPF